MGQRLNMEIKVGNETLANSYYHWSGYSSSSCEIAVAIMDYMEEHPQTNEPNKLYAIRLLEHTGAGLTDFAPTDEEKEQAKKFYNPKYYEEWVNKPSEIRTAQELFPNEKFAECFGRNEGLLAITKYGMEETRKWEEARVTIDIDSKTVDFDAYWKYSPDDYDDERERKVVDLDFDFHNMDYDTLIKLKNVIEDYCDSREYKLFKLPNGDIIDFIE